MSWILWDIKVGSGVIQDRSLRSLLLSGICTVPWQSGNTMQHHKDYSRGRLLLQDATWHGNRTALAATSINLNTTGRGLLILKDTNTCFLQKVA